MNPGTVRAFVSWSGGKETSLSCHKAIQNKDIEVTHLLNMISEDGKSSRTHGVSSKLLLAQAKAIEITITQRRTTWETYEREFKGAVSDLKKEGVRSGIFGDIDLQEHRDWVERVCGDMGITPVFPLWGRGREEILNEFIDSGFEAIIVATRADKLGPEWLGRKIDGKFVYDLKKMNGIDLCGEAGEYHTLVVSGPIFKKRLVISRAEKIKKDKNWLLEVSDYEVA